MNDPVIFDVRSGVDPETRQPLVAFRMVAASESLNVEITPIAARNLGLILLQAAVTAAYDAQLVKQLQAEAMSVRQVHEFMDAMRAERHEDGEVEPV